MSLSVTRHAALCLNPACLSGHFTTQPKSAIHAVLLILSNPFDWDLYQTSCDVGLVLVCCADRDQAPHPPFNTWGRLDRLTASCLGACGASVSSICSGSSNVESGGGAAQDSSRVSPGPRVMPSLLLNTTSSALLPLRESVGKGLRLPAPQGRPGHSTLAPGV